MNIETFKKVVQGGRAKLPVNSRPLSEIDAEIASYDDEPEDPEGPEDLDVHLKPVTPKDRIGRDNSIFMGDYVFPGVNMSDLARETGLTVGGVSRIFNGKRKAKKHTLTSIANLYTEGSVEKVKAVIRARVLRILEIDANRGTIEPEERNRMLERIR